MSEVTVTLDSIVLDYQEVPDSIGIGGEQALAVHRLIGGAKAVDAMGAYDRPLSWRGVFRGQDAMSRFRQVDSIRRSGRAVLLSWSEFSYLVIVSVLEADFTRPYLIPYSITCENIEDRATPGAPAQPLGVDAMMTGDVGFAQALAADIGDAPLTGFVGTLRAAVGKVSNFAAATQGVINTVAGPLVDCQGRVATLLGGAGVILDGVTELGGVAPLGQFGRAAASLSAQVAAMSDAADLIEINGVFGRMAKNLGAVGRSGQSILASGTDLYQLSTQAYGTLEGWATIAKANGLSDPQIVGVQEILIPPSADDSGGVLAP